MIIWWYVEPLHNQSQSKPTDNNNYKNNYKISELVVRSARNASKWLSCFYNIVQIFFLNCLIFIYIYFFCTSFILFSAHTRAHLSRNTLSCSLWNSSLCFCNCYRTTEACAFQTGPVSVSTLKARMKGDATLWLTLHTGNERYLGYRLLLYLATYLLLCDRMCLCVLCKVAISATAVTHI